MLGASAEGIAHDFNACQNVLSAVGTGQRSGREGAGGPRAGNGPAARRRARTHRGKRWRRASAASDAIPAKAVTIIHVLHRAEARGACIAEQWDGEPAPAAGYIQ